MPKKQSIAISAAAGAAPARVAKPGTTRSAAVKHSKAQTAEPVADPIEIVEVATASATPFSVTVSSDDPRQEIAKLAYGFWEARGYQHCYANEDWLRAEAEYLRRSSN